MNKRSLLVFSLAVLAGIPVACSSGADDPADPGSAGSVTSTGGAGGSAGSPGAGGAGSSTGDGAGAAGSSSGGSAGAGGSAAGAPCAAKKDQLLKPIATVSTGAVAVLSEAAGTRTVFIDASAGGSMAASTNPRVYVNLEQAKRVDVTDETAASSVEWDLALKRPVLFTNGGDGGPGAGQALLVDKDFDAVTAADATGMRVESFFESDCAPKMDAAGAVRTTFDGWYDYDAATMTLSPHAGTWVVKGATGKLYKLRILSYYANPDGSKGTSGGRYVLAWKPL